MDKEKYLDLRKDRMNGDIAIEYIYEKKGIRLDYYQMNEIAKVLGYQLVEAHALSYFDQKFNIHTMQLKNGDLMIW